MARYSFIAAAVALSALLALTVLLPAVTVLSPAVPAGGSAVTERARERVEAAHAIVDDYLKMTAEARLAADRTADAELAASRQQAAAAQAAVRTAAAPPKQARPVRVAVAAPEPAPDAAPVVAPPLPLQAPPPVAQVEPRKRPVLSRVVTTVGRVPGWVGSGVVNAASWVIDLPSQVVTSLPERRFL